MATGLTHNPRPIGITDLHSCKTVDYGYNRNHELWQKRVEQGFRDRINRTEVSLSQQMMDNEFIAQGYVFGQQLGYYFSNDKCYIQN